MEIKQEDNLKDDLLDNVSTAIKQVQLESCGGQEVSEVHFTANMWQVQELCLQLDSTFNHGLKRVVGGYWPFVQQMTHKSTVQQILGLENAVTNVVRGWAWLFIALNDRALESYVRTIVHQPQLARKHYLPHALLRDTQRLQVLVMISSGLEHLSFALEPDTACLTSWKSVSEDSRSQDDEEETDEEVEEAETASLASCDSRGNVDCDDSELLGVVTIVTLDSRTGLPLSADDIVHSSSRATRKRRKERVNSCVNDCEASNDRCGSISSRENDDETQSIDESLLLVRLMEQSLQADQKKQTISCDSGFGETVVETVATQEENENTSIYDMKTSDTKEDDRLRDESKASVEEENTSVYDVNTVINTEEETRTEETESVRLREKGTIDRKSAIKRVSFDPDNMVCILGENIADSDWKPCLTERGAPEGQEDPMSSSSLGFRCTPFMSNDDSKTTGDGGKSRSTMAASAWKLFPRAYAVDPAVVETSSKRVEDEIESEMKSARIAATSNKLLEGEVPLENNFHLLLMLEVIHDQNEKVYKVFLGSIGSTTGCPLDVYVVLTDRRFYIARWNGVEGHHDVEASVPFWNIDFLELGLNYQVVNLVCTQPRRRYYVCTGSEEITRNLVSSLEVAIRRCSEVITIPNIFTDATAQSIGLCKWIARETDLDVKTLNVDYYALVKWEDPQAVVQHSSKPGGPTKEGFLMYRYIGRPVFGLKHWRPGYFRLKTGVCYQFSDALDRTLKSYVQLIDGGCIGCRRVQAADRPHTFELILSDKRSLQLAASSEKEASDWLQVFLLAVSQGFQEDVEVPPCVSACLIQASNKLFICHEDLETNSVRSLANTEIQDVSSALLDPEGAPYCILEFESVEATESCGDWVLHFASGTELNKFMSSLRLAWENLYQVPLTCTVLSDPVLQKHCSSRGRQRNSELIYSN